MSRSSPSSSTTNVDYAGTCSVERAEGEGQVADRLRRLEAWVRVSDTLKDAFGEMLLYDAGWVAVLDDDDRFLGVLTPEALYAATRRSIEEHRD